MVQTEAIGLSLALMRSRPQLPVGPRVSRRGVGSVGAYLQSANLADWAFKLRVPAGDFLNRKALVASQGGRTWTWRSYVEALCLRFDTTREGEVAVGWRVGCFFIEETC